MYLFFRYNKPRFANDIALIKLNATVKFNDFVKPIEYSEVPVPDEAKIELSKHLFYYLLFFKGLNMKATILKDPKAELNVFSMSFGFFF